MRVYKLFLTILKSQWGQIVTYLCIFLGIMALMNVKSSESPASADDYENYKLLLAVSDEDKTPESKAFTNYLYETNRKHDIPSFEEDKIRDELFFRTVDAVVVIPKGFTKNLKNGNVEDCIDTYTLPGLMTADLAKNRINHYLTTAVSYMEKGYSLDEGLSYAKDISEIHGEVKMLNAENVGHTKHYTFFTYLAYVMLCISFVTGISVLKVLNTKELSDRMQCSPYPFSKKNLEIFLGIITLGIGNYLAFSGLSFVFFGKEMLSKNGALFFLNEAGYLIMVLALTYFFGQIIQKEALISAISNVVGLGFSFLGGVFVPLEYLGSGVLKISHFLPSYWYVKGCQFADTYTSGSITQLLHYIGIELIFAAVFYLAGVTAVKMRENK